MTRGTRLTLTLEQVVERATSMVRYRIDGEGIRYRLGTGGRDPNRPHPATRSKGGRWCCDCSGFVAWALGWDRYQPKTAVKWVETSRMIRDADGPQEMFEPLDTPELGAVVVYGDRGRRQGHTGIVTSLPAEWDPDLRECWTALGVTHCSSSMSRATGHAIAETNALGWMRRGRLLRRANY